MTDEFIGSNTPIPDIRAFLDESGKNQYLTKLNNILTLVFSETFSAEIEERLLKSNFALDSVLCLIEDQLNPNPPKKIKVS